MTATNRQRPRSMIAYLIIALFLKKTQGFSAKRWLKTYPGRDSIKDHGAGSVALSTVPPGVDISDLAITFPGDSNQRGEKQVENDRLDSNGHGESTSDDGLQDDVQAHGNNDNNNNNANNHHHGGGRKLVSASEKVETKTWRSLPLPEKQEMLHKLSQRIAMRQKVSAKVFQKSTTTVEEEKYTLLTRDKTSGRAGVNRTLRFINHGKNCDLGQAEGIWTESMPPQYPRPANANFFSSWLPFEERCRLKPLLAMLLNMSHTRNGDLSWPSVEKWQLLDLPTRGTQRLNFKTSNRLGEELHNADDPEEVSIDALDLDPTDEFDTAIKMFAVDESFRKDFREHTVCFDASGERNSDPFECPSFLKQKRILMIGDSIDRRVLESFCDLSRQVARRVGSRRKIRVEAVLEGETTSESKALPAAPVCCRGMEDCVLMCQMWIGGVSPTGPYHAQDFYDGSGRLNVTTAYRIQNLLPRLGDWMAAQTGVATGASSSPPDYVSVHSLFWDWARVNDRLIDGPGLNRNNLYKDLHPEHDFFVNWALDATALIDGVKSYLFSRGPSRTKLSWLTSPLPKELGFDSRKYVVPLNALARSIARKKGLQILDFEKMVNSLAQGYDTREEEKLSSLIATTQDLMEWTMIDRKHPDVGLSLEVFNLIMNIMLQD